MLREQFFDATATAGVMRILISGEFVVISRYIHLLILSTFMKLPLCTSYLTLDVNRHGCLHCLTASALVVLDDLAMQLHLRKLLKLQ